MNQILAEVLLTVVSGAVTVAGGFVSHYLYKKGHKATADKTLSDAQKIAVDIQNQQSLAENAVRYVEKKFLNESDVVKFDKASQTLMADAQKYGININKDDAIPLIEGALKKLEDTVASFNPGESKSVTPAQ